MENSESSKLNAVTVSCRNNIDSLLAVANRADCCVKDFLPVRDIRQFKDRFEQWAGNLGALQDFRSPKSLDHRLQENPTIKSFLLSTLHELDFSVQAAVEIASGRRENRIAAAYDIEDYSSLSDCSTVSSESEKSSTESLANQHTASRATSEVEGLVSAINTGISSLFKTSVFIRQSSADNKRLRAMKTEPFDNRADVMYVRERYPSLESKNPALATRLGEANARRRQYFKYCRSHNERLSLQPAEESLQPKAKKEFGVGDQNTRSAKSTRETEIRPSIFAETEATKMSAKMTTGDFTLDVQEEKRAASVASFATSVANVDEGELSFPPVPNEALHAEPFVCHYCFNVIHLKSPTTDYYWRRHVIQDLEPYICTFPSCGLDTFRSQLSWFEHELLMHRLQWDCSECLISFPAPAALEHHIIQQHSGTISDQQRSVMVEQSKRNVQSIRPEECPFCTTSWAEADTTFNADDNVLVVSLDDFRRHLGYHLLQVALFALPRILPDDGSSLSSKVARRSQGLLSRGWQIIFRRWSTVVTLAIFLEMYQSRTTGSSLVLKLLRSPSDSEALQVDIVAVHGLNGHATRTWTHQQTRTFWLKDLLPNDLPGARIFTFGYNSNPVFRPSIVKFDYLPEELLWRMIDERYLNLTTERPIVFIAHALGGIIVKQALLLARERDSEDIHHKTVGIVFLGTPHNKSNYAGQILALPKMPNASRVLTRHKEDSVQRVNKDFLHQSVMYQTVSVYESKNTEDLSQPSVERDLGELSLRNDDVIFANKDNVDISKFETANDHIYRKIIQRIIRMLEDHYHTLAGESIQVDASRSKTNLQSKEAVEAERSDNELS